MFHYYLNSDKSPAYFNLARSLRRQGWCSTQCSWRADFGERNFEFAHQAAECLEFKDLLAELVLKFCPEVMPLTFSINDETWPLIVQLLAQTDGADKQVWILKPAKLNNGQHIKIFENLPQIEAHYLSARRMGGPQVLQQYISQPHLIKGPQEGHKYSLRMFVVLTNYAGVYLYPYGYYNIALQPYVQGQYDNLRSHLTNEHLEDGVLNVVQIPTVQYAALFEPLYPQIKTIVTEVCMGLRQLYPEAFLCKSQPTLALFGFDFLVDAKERVWLIEANHGPCFPTAEEHPLQKKLYSPFWQEVTQGFVIPIATQEGAYSQQVFERLGVDGGSCVGCSR